jgi:translocation and assembly module TamB
LTLDLTETGGALRGEILIPEARIQPRARPEGVVMPSRDVVIKGSDRPPAYPLDLAIRLAAGDAVHVDAFGLSGRIAGSLDLTRAAGRTLAGDGRLSIIEGEYRVPIGPRRLAQLLPPLTISRGELIWAQTPLLNPGLLVQAQRSTGQTTANVRILGTLTDPRLTFFSDRDPDMSESDAIFFLLTGMTPSGRQPEQIAVLDLGAWITAGTFLKLQTGLGTGLSQLRLRRDLSERLQIQVQGGVTPSADLFWTYEH